MITLTTNLAYTTPVCQKTTEVLQETKLLLHSAKKNIWPTEVQLQ